jgi:hypothetical protein
MPVLLPQPRALGALVFWAATAVGAAEPACPPGETVQWIADHCMASLETDDEIAASDCIARGLETKFPSECAARLHFKRGLCEIVVKNGSRAGTVAACVADPAFAGSTVRNGGVGGASAAPFQREMELVYVFEGDRPDFLFRVGQAGFRSVAALQEHLATWPAGSELKWAPGCEFFGDEPLLSSEADMAAFRAFLAQRQIRFVLVPSG